MSLKATPIGHLTTESRGTRVLIDEEYRAGLLGMEQFTHVILLVWLDRNDTAERRKTLRVHPCGDSDNPLTGVFATRSPARPNPIGHYATSVLSVEADGLLVATIDALDGTPVLDIKPYIPVSDSHPDAGTPRWVGRR